MHKSHSWPVNFWKFDLLLVYSDLFLYLAVSSSFTSRIFSYLHVSISKLLGPIVAFCIFSKTAENPWKHWLFCIPASRRLTSLNAIWGIFIPQICHKFMLEYGIDCLLQISCYTAIWRIKPTSNPEKMRIINPRRKSSVCENTSSPNWTEPVKTDNRQNTPWCRTIEVHQGV